MLETITFPRRSLESTSPNEFVLFETLDHDQPKLQGLPTPQGVVVIKNNSIIMVIKQVSPVFEVK
ncbi:hypothetical protein HanXRQr2_Chr04g0164531 [Helianthus annuus]|uniref:Uncharacterized protein n=1 Tax=Helianthus annuus TaxID=4232 RepID=A0A9K3J787_HELAN|nr:hypothetical protein HanXRQr2_Chr04g0164531 [Helianthus annuus]KAJ0931171.1 hypothetical protein HanPSC8_Chr04g0158421 [Helianthus annuus]